MSWGAPERIKHFDPLTRCRHSSIASQDGPAVIIGRVGMVIVVVVVVVMWEAGGRSMREGEGRS